MSGFMIVHQSNISIPFYMFYMFYVVKETND